MSKRTNTSKLTEVSNKKPKGMPKGEKVPFRRAWSSPETLLLKMAYQRHGPNLDTLANELIRNNIRPGVTHPIIKEWIRNKIKQKGFQSWIQSTGI